MSMNNPYSQYSLNQINTATPGKLLIMTFDGAIRFAHTAAANMKEHKLYEQNENIKKIQNILIDLISTLNPKIDSQLAANLSSIYSYMFDRLTYANMKDDVSAITEVIEMLKELRTTWANAELIVRSGEQNTVLEAEAA
ncbi:MAG: flagellar export chaperone FliS [Armatimonadota bacterium]